jgi:alanyl-tRNA synthetase
MNILSKINEVHVHNKLAHTAEHAFIGSLQRLVNQTIKVRKVEHRKTDNSVFVSLARLDLDPIFAAAYEVNSMITNGRKIIIHSFESLSEAKKAFPTMRANEERIEKSNPVRVVEIKDHDISACAMEHTEDLANCEFFLVTGLSKDGDIYEVKFVVGKEAREAAIILCAKLMRICSEIGANSNTIENTVKKLKIESGINCNKLKRLTSEKLSTIMPIINRNGTIFIQGTFSDLEDEEIRKFVSKKTAESKNTVIFIANQDSDSDINSNIVFARTKDMLSVDCNQLFKQICGSDGRGGGKADFVLGMVKNERLSRIIDEIMYEL